MKLIRTCLLLIMPIFFIGTVNAQYSLGIKVGITNSWQEYGDNQERTTINGFNAYILSAYEINSFIQLNVDLGFVQRGGQDNRPLTPILSVGGYRYFFEYIDLPVSLQGKLPIYKNRLHIFGKAGCGISYLLNAQGQLLDLAFQGREKLKMDNEALNLLDYGLNIGTGIEYGIRKNKIILALDYYYGLNDSIVNKISKNRNLNVDLTYVHSF